MMDGKSIHLRAIEKKAVFVQLLVVTCMCGTVPSAAPIYSTASFTAAGKPSKSSGKEEARVLQSMFINPITDSHHQLAL